MIRPSLLAVIFFQMVIGCIGQDTIKVGAGFYYTSDKEPYRGKDFASRVKYGREDIVFSETHQRIEYCYYYDNERHCSGKDYKLLNDSALEVDGAIWNYRMQGDQYFVERYSNVTYESGFAKTLIPLETVGVFTTTTADKMDTLWAVDYSKNKSSSTYDRAFRSSVVFHKTRITGKIYSPDEINERPTLLNGDSLGPVYLSHEEQCISGPGYFAETMTFVITKEGRIVNIEQGEDNLFVDFCPPYFMGLIMSVLEIGPINPARLNGMAVNTKWTLIVEPNNEKEE